MIRKLIFLLALLLFCSSINFAQTSKLPPPPPDRIATVDVKHITLDLRFDWIKKQALGKAIITLSTLQKTNKINLDAGLLSINSIILNGKALKFNYDGGDKADGLEILLDKAYLPTQNISLSIDYHTNWVNQSDPNAIGGSFGKGLRFFEPTWSTPKKRKQIWSFGEPENNKYWFPCHESPNDLRTTEFFATVESPLTVISNGNLVATQQNTNGTKTFHYKADTPYLNYLTSFVVGEYVEVQQQSLGILLRTFCYPDEKLATQATVERLPDMVKYFSEITGSKFPYPSYSQVMVQDLPFPSLVGQHTASTISDNMIDDDRTHADFLYLWDGVESEALAAQWFGNLISVRDWSHAWLTKSLAHYLEGQYSDYKNGHDEYLMWYHNFDRGATLGDWAAGVRHPLVTQNFESLNSFLTADNYPRSRGTLVLRMLQKQIGNEKWWKALQLFVKNNAHKSVTTQDFQRAIATATGENMDWFFDQWVYKIGQPFFEVSKTYHTDKKQLTVTIKQTQQLDTNKQYPHIQYFKGKMSMEIDERIETVLLEAKEANTFSFNLSNEPKLMNVDFENTWIAEIKQDKTFEENLYLFQNSQDILARMVALNELATIAKDEKTNATDKAKIIEAFKKVIDGNSYWRLRTATIGALQGIIFSPSNKQMPVLDESTEKLILKNTKNSSSIVRASCISFLGVTKDPKHIDIYLNAFNDISDRVILPAANALAKTKDPRAFQSLVQLKDKPSWKNQSLMAALSGLKILGDERGTEIALNAIKDNTSPRWYLGNFWDYPYIAAQTLAGLGKGDLAYPIILERFKQSMKADDINDIFSNVLLITTLADPRGQEVFEQLKVKYKADANAMTAVNFYEGQFKEALKNKTP